MGLDSGNAADGRFRRACITSQSLAALCQSEYLKEIMRAALGAPEWSMHARLYANAQASFSIHLRRVGFDGTPPEDAASGAAGPDCRGVFDHDSLGALPDQNEDES
jgi:hypothetical protein